MRIVQFLVTSLIIVITFPALAQTMSYVNSKVQTCNSCKIIPSAKKSKKSKAVSIRFTLKEEEGMVRVQAVNFTYSDKQKQTDILTDDDLGWQGKKISFPFFKLDLNADGFYDLALRVFSKSSSKYEYWVYNPNTKKYVHQIKPIFELSRTVDKSKVTYSNEVDYGMGEEGRDLREEEYSLDKNYRLRKITKK